MRWMIHKELLERPWKIGRAMFAAARRLFAVGGLDLAASLAYYTLLSFFPLVALITLLFANIFDADTLRDALERNIALYFPASREFLIEALDQLLEKPLTTGVLAFPTMLWGVSGLFNAVIRSVNRIFDTPSQRTVHLTGLQLIIAGSMIGLFLVSLGLTVAFRFVLVVAQPVVDSGGMFSGIVLSVLQIASASASIIVTMVLFIIAYRTIPNRLVPWRNAALGALVGILLFEGAKQVFFWSVGVFAERNLVYGPLSSVITVLVWSHLAGLTFLYGASLTKLAISMRLNERVLVDGG